VDVRSCPAADSVLGPAADDTKGRVRGLYGPESDSTFLVTGLEHTLGRVSFSTKFQGARPTREPTATLIVMFRGNDARTVKESPTTPRVTLLLDDSVTIQPAPVLKGQLVGPQTLTLMPLSALVLPAEWVRLAQASEITVHVDNIVMRLTGDERRDLRALYRVAVCPTAG